MWFGFRRRLKSNPSIPTHPNPSYPTLQCPIQCNGIQCNPFETNPIQSIPNQANPTKTNPIESNRIQSNPILTRAREVPHVGRRPRLPCRRLPRQLVDGQHRQEALAAGRGGGGAGAVGGLGLGRPGAVSERAACGQWASVHQTLPLLWFFPMSCLAFLCIPMPCVALLRFGLCQTLCPPSLCSRPGALGQSTRRPPEGTPQKQRKSAMDLPPTPPPPSAPCSPSACLPRS